MDRRSLPAGARIVLLALAYVVTARAGLSLGAVSGMAAPVWPPAGIALAAMLVAPQLWPGIMLGAFLTNFSIGVPVLVAAVIAVGNTLEPIVGAALLRRIGFRRSLDRVQDALWLVAFGAVVAPACSAILGVTAGYVGGVVEDGTFLRTLMTWWIGDAMGAIVVAPVLLTWQSGPRLGGLLERPLEAASLLGGLLVTGLLVFEESFFVYLGGATGAYVLFPFVVWAALRFGPAGASGATLLASLLATQATAQESGPFAIGETARSLFFLQSFMAVLATTGMVLAAAIGERRRAQAEVLQLNGILQHLNAELEARVVERTAGLQATTRELEAFTSAVAHDLRAPLRHLDGFANLLLARSETFDETARRHLRSISTAAARLGRLVDDLLAFSQTGRSGLRTQPVDLRALVEEVRCELVAEQADREIEWSINGLPPVQGDPALLRTALANLLSNAIKFSAPRQRPRVEIGVEPDPHAGGSEEVTVFVRDNGIGFDARYSDKLFRVFERLHTDGEFDGTGMGLATVQRVIDRHGGRVWATGDIDAGATFYFTLRRA